MPCSTSNPPRCIAIRLCVAWLAALCWSGAVCAAEPGQPEVPVVAGVTFVIAVSNATNPTQPLPHVAQDDYEVVVTITAVDDDAIALSAFIDALDTAGTRRQVTIPRRQRESDLAGATEQILGFVTGDPLVLDDSTSLGPSRQVVDALRTTGVADQCAHAPMVYESAMEKCGEQPIASRLRRRSRLARLAGSLGAARTRNAFEPVLLSFY